ncbi:MAG TPA: alpha/beta hydrolase [Chryseolinea sp.]|nr:alpha/beta hydrolase [Chryseolinea sp.]
MQDRFVQTENAILHYTVVGTGNKTLLLFHGFGQDNEVFQPLAQALSSTYTLYIFDLYFHGKSKWANDEQPLEKVEWKKIMNTFLSQNTIDAFFVGGFSLGGKFAMATAEAFPEKTKALFLIAPDGIKTSFWYSIATYPFLFRKLFKSMITNPGTFNALANVIQSIGLVDKGLIRFAEHQMNTQEKRNQVYYSWVVFRRMTFDLSKLAKLLNDHHIPVTMVTGRYDKVILTRNMNHFLEKLANPHIAVLDSGHNSLLNELKLPELFLSKIQNDKQH